MESDNYIDSLKVGLRMHSALAPYQAQGEADDIVDRYVVPAVQAVVDELGRDFDANISQLEIDVGRVRLQDLREAIESALRSALEKYRISSGESFAPAVASLQEYTDAGIVPWENGGRPFSPSHLLKDFLKDDSDTFQESMESFSEKELVGLLLAVASVSDAESMAQARPIREAILVRLSRDYPETAAVLTARMDVWRQFGEVLASLSVADDEDTNVSAEATDVSEELPELAPRVFRYVEIDQRDVPDDHSVVSMDYMDAPGEEAPEFIVSPGPPRRYFRKVSADTMADSSGPSREESEAAAAAVAAAIPADDTIVDSTETFREEPATSADKTVSAGGIMADSPKALREEVDTADRNEPAGGIVADSSETVQEELETATDKTVPADGTLADSSKTVWENLETETDKGVPADGVPVDLSVVLRKDLEEDGDKPVVAADTIPDSSEALTEDLETAGSKEVAAAGGNGIVQEKEVVTDKVQGGKSPETGRYRYVRIDLTDIPEGYRVVPMGYSDAPGEGDPEYIVSVAPPLKYFRKVPVGWDEGIFEGKDIRSEATREEFKGEEDQLYMEEEATGTEEEMERNAATARTMESELMPERDRISGEKIKEKKTEVSEAAEEEKRGQAEKSVTGSFRYVGIGLTDIPEGCPVVTMEYTDAPDENAPEYIVSIGSTLKYYRKVSVSSSGISLDRGGKPDRPMIQFGTEHKHEISEEEAGLMTEEAEGREEDAVEETKGEEEEKDGTENYRKAETGLRNYPDGPSAETGPAFRDVRSVWEIRDFESDIPDGRIPVSDAGLVLLHPFIGRMMANLGLVKDGMFVSPLARIRAVHLLRDLTGSDEPHHNHNLILEKVLCGLPVGYLLPPEWKPTKREKEETEALLRAVCDYWKPLSKSSTAALCGSFIQRAGAIERFQDTWTILVEGRTIDILMDDLPWGVSIIYLPWLETPLAVEWQRE